MQYIIIVMQLCGNMKEGSINANNVICLILKMILMNTIMTMNELEFELEENSTDEDIYSLLQSLANDNDIELIDYYCKIASITQCERSLYSYV